MKESEHQVVGPCCTPFEPPKSPVPPIGVNQLHASWAECKNRTEALDWALAALSSYGLLTGLGINDTTTYQKLRSWSKAPETED